MISPRRKVRAIRAQIRRDPSPVQHRPARPYTPDQEWQTELDARLQDYFPQRTGIVLEQLVGRNLYPRIEAPITALSIDPGTGAVHLGITVPSGTVRYTLDGSDPRPPAGGRLRRPVPAYLEPIALDRSVHVKAHSEKVSVPY